jgi:uncharacterized protein
VRGKRGVRVGRRAWGLALTVFPLTSYLSPLTGQAPATAQAPAVAQERAAYLAWLTSAPVSPYAAIAQLRIGSGIRLGPPSADIPLDSVPSQQVTERDGRVTLEGGGRARPLSRGRAVPLGIYTLVTSGPPGRATLSVFGRRTVKRPPAYFPYDSSLAFTVRLEPPEQQRKVLLLALDGTEVEATEAGTVAFGFGGKTARFLVRRIPGDEDESDLEIYFRDATNGKDTYPAGRFLTLLPLSDGRYRLDFNRARNPFCAYSSVYACPAPWRGNSVPGAVRAGEKYAGGGLKAPATPGSEK